jgi:hypothetical protein
MKGGRILGFLLWALFVGSLVEITARVFWRVRYGVPLLDTRKVEQTFYPELYGPRAARPSHSDSVVDVLLLGGSVLNSGYGAVRQALLEQLTLTTRRPVRVFSLGMPAHTSRDSYYKYRALSGAQFEAVVLYDGFNEVRANNAPPALFREDYSHYAYYRLLRDLMEDRRLWPLATPYTVVHLAREWTARAAERRGEMVRLPRHTPDSAWTAFGANLRTPTAFRRNIESILDIGAARGDPVILVTFATYVPPGYSETAFRDRKLDYAMHTMAISAWGRPENVQAAVAAHNDVIRRLHAERPAAGFVDMDASFPRERRYFNDICHLTVEGSQRFASLLSTEVIRQLGSRRPEGSTGATR